MEIEPILQIIGLYGFPIAAFLLMYRDRRDDRKRLEQIMDNFMNHLNDNTKALQHLSDLIQEKM